MNRPYMVSWYHQRTVTSARFFYTGYTSNILIYAYIFAIPFFLILPTNLSWLLSPTYNTYSSNFFIPAILVLYFFSTYMLIYFPSLILFLFYLIYLKKKQCNSFATHSFSSIVPTRSLEKKFKVISRWYSLIF